MSTIAQETTLMPADLLAMPDGEAYELVDGQLVERKTGSESSWIGGTLYFRLREFADHRNLGWVWPADAGYRCFPDDPNRVRRPDISFVRHGRLPEGRPSQGFEHIPPDFVAEIISPNELFYDVERKVEEYLHAGIRLVWVINPATHTLTVYRADGSLSRFHDRDDVTGEGVLPGFRILVGSLFPSAAQSQPAKADEAESRD